MTPCTAPRKAGRPLPLPRRLLPLCLATALAGTLLWATPAHAQEPPAQRPLRILSLNAEHLMSPTRFGQWQSYCRPLGWREPDTSRDQAGAIARRPADMSYCNALDGTDGRGHRRFAPVHDREAWEQKRAQLAALLRAADADVVLLQEVSDAEAARMILGQRYEVVGSEELWREGRIAQNLAIGWRVGMAFTAADVELVQPISQRGEDGHRTRPGLALVHDLGGGRKLAILNLHLKAGCRQGRLDEATSQMPERMFRRQADCAVLQRQVAALEDWTDRKLRQGFGVLLAGDFNRDLRREIRDRMPARSDGSNPAAPVRPGQIASLVAEISDRDPPAAHFSLIPARRYPKLADCHRHIDGFLLSRNAEPWLAVPLRQLSTTVIPFDRPISLDRVRPSDHCPHLIQLPWRQRQ